MIAVKFWLDDVQKWGSSVVLDAYAQLPDIDYRFDESFSTASFMCYSDDLPYTLPIEPWTKCELTLDGDKFIGFVSSYSDELIQFGGGVNGNKQVIIELVELVAVTQYIPMSNLNFTNDITTSVNSSTGVVTTNVTTKTAGQVVERLSRQIFNLHGQETPFSLQYQTSDWWVGITMPEFRFSDNTLFDCLKDIGDAVGGFPYLEFVSNGQYLLRFLQWNNQATKKHTDGTVQGVSRTISTDNQGFIVDSTVENLLSVNDKGDNAVTFPAINGFKSLATESYQTQVSKDTAFIRVDKPVFKLLKVEAYSKIINTQYGKTEASADLTYLFVEFDRWKTLRDGVSVMSIPISTGEAKNTRGYWTYNGKEIKNLKEIFVMLLNCYIVGIGGDPSEISKTLWWYVNEATPIFDFKITYIPTSSARLMAIADNATKPIGQTYNQGSNIIQASSYASNLQGLANRIHGKKTTVQKQSKRGDTLYSVGEWLNGEIITEAHHEYSPTTVFSTYSTSPNFNRRNPFIFFPHQQRQWAIPADGQVVDRQLLYIDEIQCSIGETLEESDGALTNLALTKYLTSYAATTEVKPNLAYLAWKSSADIANDTNAMENENYALATVVSVPFGRSILMHWQAEDNASMGARTYGLTALGEQNNNLVQTFVPYDEKATYLNVKMSSKVPTSYDFDSELTGTAEGLYDPENVENNQTFQRTFPMSNKKQWSNAVSLVDFTDLRIDKDLSERIMFNYLMQFVGKNGTIVYDGACSLNPLCNSDNGVTGFKVWYSNEPYSYYDVKPKGTEYTPYYVSVGTIIKDNVNMVLITEYSGDYTAVAVTDQRGNLLFAKNGAASGGLVDIYLSNVKKKWTKI